MEKGCDAFLYLYQPCLLSLALFAWAFEEPKNGRWLRTISPVIVLLLSEWELSFRRIWIYPAALLLPMLYLPGRVRTVFWAEVLTAALLGGLTCWKMDDTWPLQSISHLMAPMLLLVIAVLLCRDRKDRCLACALGSLLYELFFCLREYMLFSFCITRLGSRESLSLGSAALCLYVAGEQAAQALRRRKSIAVPSLNE